MKTHLFITSEINKKIVEISPLDREFINLMLDTYYPHNPVVCAEKISEYLMVSFDSIFDIL